MVKDKQILQLTFLPYIFLKEELQIEEFIFWPFDKKKDEYIKDFNIKRYLELIFCQYITRTEEKLKDITIISLKNGSNFQPFPESQFEKLKAIVLILAFCTIIRNSPIIFFCNENFEIIRQNFSIGKDKIAIQA